MIRIILGECMKKLKKFQGDSLVAEKFWAVIVTYNPDLVRLERNISNLLQQKFSIIIVDNHSENVDQLKDLFSNVTIRELSENMGIAAALNIGMREAKAYGATWVLSSDQDTEFDVSLLNEYLRFLTLENVGALCPVIHKRGEENLLTWEKQTEEVEKCPTSGFFIKMSVWDIIGEYDEWMFIDYVDYDLCIRLRIAGFRIFRVNTTFAIQELGNRKVIKWLNQIGKIFHWRRIQNLSITYNHSPLRNYYFVRNSLYYINKHKEYLSVSEEYRHIIKWELKKILLEKDRIANMKAIIKGIRDFKLVITKI